MKRTKRLEFAIKFAKFCQQTELNPEVCAEIVELAEYARKNATYKSFRRLDAYCNKFALKVSADCNFLQELGGNDQTKMFVP